MAERIAIITGTSSGIGRALAEELLARDWLVVGVSRRSVEFDQERYLHIRADLADLPRVEHQLVPRLEQMLNEARWKRVALVNNAADAGQMRLMVGLKAEALAHVLTVNVAAPVLLMGMCLRRGPRDAAMRFVNLTSGAGTTAYAGLCDYGSSKAGLRLAGMVAASEAEATARSDFAVLSYSPGTVDTPMQALARARNVEDFPLAGRFREFAADGSLISPGVVATDLAVFLEGDGPPGFTERRFGE